MHLVFGYTEEPRDPKYAQPWNTHPEFKKKTESAASSEVKTKKVSHEAGIIRSTVNKLVGMIFPIPQGPRDEKWAEPWQTHKEHAKKVVDEVKKAKPEPRKESFFKFNFVNSFIQAIFGKETVGTRDPKWTEPWQTHEEHKRKAAKPVEEKPKKAEPIRHDNIISRSVNSFITLFFDSPKGEREPKWAQPWQTHEQHKKKPVEVKEKPKPEKHKGAGVIGQFINKMVYLVFKENKDPRDPKWAEPWQTHAEHKKKEVKEVPTKKVVKEYNFFGLRPLLNSAIETIFGARNAGPREQKWAEPWQTHKKPIETAAPPRTAAPTPSPPPKAAPAPPPPPPKAAPAPPPPPPPPPKAAPAPPPPPPKAAPAPPPPPPPPKAAPPPPPPTVPAPAPSTPKVAPAPPPSPPKEKVATPVTKEAFPSDTEGTFIFYV